MDNLELCEHFKGKVSASIKRVSAYSQTLLLHHNISHLIGDKMTHSLFDTKVFLKDSGGVRPVTKLFLVSAERRQFLLMFYMMPQAICPFYVYLGFVHPYNNSQ